MGRSHPERVEQTRERGGLRRLNRVPMTFRLAVGLWLLLLATTPFFMLRQQLIVEFPDQSLMGDAAIWNPPLSQLLMDAGFVELPFVVAAAVVAATLAFGVSRCDSHWSLSLMAVVGLTQIEHASPIADVGCIWLAGMIGHRLQATAQHSPPPSGIIKHLAVALLVFWFAIVVSLEAGIVLFILTFKVAWPGAVACWREQGARRIALSILALGALTWLVPAVVSADFAALLLRPLSWIWLQPPTELLPSMTPIWNSDGLSWPHLLVGIFWLERWYAAIVRKSSFGHCALLAVLSLMAFGCTRYFWLSSAALIMLSWEPTRVEPLTTRKRWEASYAANVALTVGALAFLRLLISSGSTVLAADIVQREIDVAQWNLSGSVWLTNLEQAGDWQRPGLRRQYRPVLSDRWDALSKWYSEYAATCNDWKEWKREAYVRSDGTWGGYQRVFAEWQPVLVIADSTDLRGLHRVSLDSKWKTLGIDHRRTIFALSESPASSAYVQHATAALTVLELPRQMGNIEIERVVALGAGNQTIRVSAALTALRLPFAAIRVLPADPTAARSTAEAFAWSELAHRVYRYSGHHSLSDCVRAQAAESHLAGEPYLVAQTLLRLENLNNSINAGAALERADSQVQPSPESRIRVLLLQGKAQEAKQLAGGLEEGFKRQYYTTIAAEPNVSRTDTIGEFKRLFESRAADSAAHECAFILGCLAIEEGDVGLARQALNRLLELDPQSPFAGLAGLYLQQLGR